MIKKLAIALVVGVAGLLAYASTMPDSFRVSRTVSINAPAKKVWPFVNDVKLQNEWSPWDDKDPQLKKEYAGPSAGKGAVYTWDGNKDVGRGRLEIVDSLEPKLVVMDLQFEAPMKARDTAKLELAEKGKATDVTWSIEGPMPFASKVMCVFMDMDKMIGAEFEKGLGELKVLAEKGA